MYSGIIRNLGKVEETRRQEQSGKLEISSEIFSKSVDAVKIGDSIAINGVCLTVVALNNATAEFDLGTETIKKTTLGNLKKGAIVNLERCLKLSDRVDGNLVQGHIDTTIKLLRRQETENTVIFEFELPADLKHLIVQKGYVTLDGVALTVGEVFDNSFLVYIIPYTLEETTFKNLQVNEKVNLEIDSIARYVERILLTREVNNETR